MKKRLIFLLLLQQVNYAIYSQVSIWRQAFGQGDDIVFDASGKMVNFPLTFVTNKTAFNFKVISSSGIYEPWLKILKKNLEESKDFMSSSNIDKAYSCFFGQIYTDLTKAIDELVNFPTSTCNPEDFKKISQKTRDLLPIDALVSNIRNQFSVKLYLNNTCIKTIALKAEGNCSQDCIEFQSVSTFKIKDIECKSCLAEGPSLIRFELIQDNPWNKLIRDWYTTKASNFNNHYKKKSDSLIGNLKTIAEYEETAKEEFKKNLETEQVLKTWFLNWIWFNGGKLALDPFNMYTQDGKDAVAAELKTVNQKIKEIRENLVYLDSVKAAAYRSNAAFPTIIRNLTDRANKEDELEEKLKRKAELETPLPSGKTVSALGSYTVLYEGKMQRSTTRLFNKSINPHKQYDALTGYNLIPQAPFARRKTIEIPEDEQLYIAVHNVPDTVRAIHFEEKTLAFNDLEEFTRILGEQFTQFETLSNSMSNLQNLEEFVKALVVSGIGPKGAHNIPPDKIICSEIKPLLLDLLDLYVQGQQTFPPKPDLFAKLTASPPVNRTELKALKSEDAPFRDSVVIRALYKTDSADVAKTIVKVGKLRLFQLTAGIAVNRKPAYTTSIDTTGGGFKVSSSDNAATAIFGVKLYPFRNYNRDHGLLPRYPLRRLSVMGAFEMLHPLDNFYLGGAYDIIPGLAVSVGTNWYKRTNYQVENNTITATSKRYERSGTYYALTVNPVLLAQFVKLFFKTI